MLTFGRHTAVVGGEPGESDTPRDDQFDEAIGQLLYALPIRARYCYDYYGTGYHVHDVLAASSV